MGSWGHARVTGVMHASWDHGVIHTSLGHGSTVSGNRSRRTRVETGRHDGLDLAGSLGMKADTEDHRMVSG